MKKTIMSILHEAELFSEAEKRALNSEDIDNFDKIRKLSLKHNRLCEAYCNNDVPDYDKKIKRIESQIIELAKKISNKLICDFQHDPRGLTCRLKHNSNFLNEYYYIMGFEDD